MGKNRPSQSKSPSPQPSSDERQIDRLRAFVSSPSQRSRPRLLKRVLTIGLGVWLGMVLLGGGAFLILSNPRFVRSPQVEPEGKLSPWSLGAIALCCAGSCLAIARWLDRE